MKHKNHWFKPFHNCYAIIAFKYILYYMAHTHDETRDLKSETCLNADELQLHADETQLSVTCSFMRLHTDEIVRLHAVRHWITNYFCTVWEMLVSNTFVRYFASFAFSLLRDIPQLCRSGRPLSCTVLCSFLQWADLACSTRTDEYTGHGHGILHSRTFWNPEPTRVSMTHCPNLALQESDAIAILQFFWLPTFCLPLGKEVALTIGSPGSAGSWRRISGVPGLWLFFVLFFGTYWGLVFGTY